MELRLTTTAAHAAPMEQTLTLAVGGTTLEGGSRYVRVNDDTTIYSIAEDKLSAVLTAADSGLTA